jgi:hypothetical protein
VRTRRLPPIPIEVRQHVPRSWVRTDLADLLALDAPRRAEARRRGHGAASAQLGQPDARPGCRSGWLESGACPA